MQNNNLLSWCFTIFLVSSYWIGINSISLFYQNTGIPILLLWIIVLLLPWIIWLEIVIKISFLKILTPLEFINIEINSKTEIDLEKLAYYDSELTKLGFIHLTNYTAESIAGVSRLFCHPQHNCFAEVGFMKNIPVFCTITAAYQQKWSIAVTNQQLPPGIRGVQYAFLRLPRDIYKIVSEEPAFLFQTFKAWHQEIIEVLNVDLDQDNTTEFYFARVNQTRALQKQSLLTKSIVWCLIEMWIFSLNSKSEWLGDFRKIKST